jgi:hypothetical protein
VAHSNYDEREGLRGPGVHNVGFSGGEKKWEKKYEKKLSCFSTFLYKFKNFSIKIELFNSFCSI